MTNLLDGLKSKALNWAKPLPFECRHREYSTIASMDDQAGQPTRRLVEASVAAIRAALDVDLSTISAMMKTEPRYPDIWPGEHYKLLAGFAKTLRPRKVIEIGTFQGVGTLSIHTYLPPESRTITLDIMPWQKIDSAILRSSDFEDGRLTQVIGDLSDEKFFRQFAPEVEECDFLFVDAPKNVIFEATLLRWMEDLTCNPNLFVLFDDIRVWNMLSIWRSIKRPKLDLTSFGHWSGTGIIDWNG